MLNTVSMTGWWMTTGASKKSDTERENKDLPLWTALINLKQTLAMVTWTEGRGIPFYFISSLKISISFSCTDQQYINHLVSQHHLRKETFRLCHSLHWNIGEHFFFFFNQMDQFVNKSKKKPRKFSPELNFILTKICLLFCRSHW